MTENEQIGEIAEIINKPCFEILNEAGVMDRDCPFPYECTARNIYNAGYRKASEVALETVDDFQGRLRDIFIDMCGCDDYNTVNLLQIDSAIETLFDSFVAELKKKYTGANNERE